VQHELTRLFAHRTTVHGKLAQKCKKRAKSRTISVVEVQECALAMGGLEDDAEGEPDS